MRQFFTFFCCANFFCCAISTAQTTADLAIGEWKQHLPFQIGIHVTQSDDQVFYATRFGLLVIDKADRALERVTKVEGLSGVGANFVKYNSGSQTLLLAHDGGVIDLVREDGILTLFGIASSDILLGEKTITDVFMANDSIAYISGNFGITTLNLNTGLFPNTVKMPLEARSVAVFEGHIYVSTGEGLYTVNPAEVANIDDFSNWTWLAGTNGLPGTYSAGALCIFNEKLYLDVSDSIYVFDGGAAQYVHHVDTFPINFLSADGEHLLAGFECPNNCTGKVLVFDQNQDHSNAGSQCVDRPEYAVETASGEIWYADRATLFRVQAAGSGTCQRISVNSPATINAIDLAFNDGQLWAATGGIDLTFSALGRRDGLFSLIDGTWKQHSQTNTPALAEQSDFIDVEIDPMTGDVWAGVFWDGLAHYQQATGEFEVFNENNSALQLSVGDPNRSRVTGLALDQENNLWMCNNLAPRPLVVRKADGSFQNFSLSKCTNDEGIFGLEVDGLGYKWMRSIDFNAGLTVFDEGEFDDDTDDRCTIINESNSVLPSNEISSLKVDRDGAFWVGTKLGAAVFQCDPFNGECPGTLPFVTVDGFGATLLEDTEVLCIGVDGANRKWFGTPAGLFIMSPEGNEQIAHLTTENSPLFSNTILSVAFDNETGEVFIGTARGIISFRSDATGATNFHKKDVTVFPNPVRPGYEGPIAIKGLAEDATVKITDVSGQLVFETEALGGQAIWNGRDYNDRRVNTGVYLVFATSRSSTDPDVEVTKILVVN